MKFRNKPIVVDATQWFKNGDHPKDHVAFASGTKIEPTSLSEGMVVRYFRHPNIPGVRPCDICGVSMHEHGWIDTLEAGHNVCPGDWIITGIAGEIYPCKPHIFEATYEAVSDETLSVPRQTPDESFGSKE